MKTRVQELCQIGDQLFTKRFPLLTLWQTFAENFYPLRADMTRVRYISEEFASYLMTGRPVLAHRELSNAINAILRPRNMEWFKASTGIDQVDKDPQAQRWLEQASAAMRRLIYYHKSNFTRATKEGDADFILFGQCCIEPYFNKDMTGINFRSWHLRDCVWTEDSDLNIDSLHRKWTLGARQLYRLAETTGGTWKTNLDDKVKTAAEKDAAAEVKCRVIVIPTDEYDSFGKDEKGQPNKRPSNHPYIRITLDEDNQRILEELPQPELGYVIPRWVTIGGFSQYAYSPTAIVALPDARMLQQIYLTLIEVGQKSVDPPLLAAGDVINGSINFYAGGITWMDPDYDERTGEALRPMTIDRSGIQWGTEFLDRIETVLKEAFYLNVLNLPPLEEGDKMTATEVQARIREYIQRATPLFEPMDLEYNGQLCASTYRMMERIGAFGSPFDRPQALRGRNIEFKFVNPLVQAEGERKLSSFTQVGQLLGAAMQFDNTVLADIDMDTAVRDAFEGTGAPSTWLRPKDQADQIKAQARQQQEATQAANQLGNVAEQGGKAATAVQNVGQAATSLQDAGLSG